MDDTNSILHTHNEIRMSYYGNHISKIAEIYVSGRIYFRYVDKNRHFMFLILFYIITSGSGTVTNIQNDIS